jgi:uncharacterized protein YjbJ (UPF0337 family)
MNWDTTEANWKVLKGKPKNRWGKLTDDDLAEIDGKREQPLGELEEYYSGAKEELEHDVDKWGRGQAYTLEAKEDCR